MFSLVVFSSSVWSLYLAGAAVTLCEAVLTLSGVMQTYRVLALLTASTAP